MVCCVVFCFLFNLFFSMVFLQCFHVFPKKVHKLTYEVQYWKGNAERPWGIGGFHPPGGQGGVYVPSPAGVKEQRRRPSIAKPPAIGSTNRWGALQHQCRPLRRSTAGDDRCRWHPRSVCGRVRFGSHGGRTRRRRPRPTQRGENLVLSGGGLRQPRPVQKR
jgi:hypothetical protein